MRKEYDVIMYVYEDLNYDARVKRSIDSLREKTNMYVISSGGNRINDWYENKVLAKKYKGFLGYLCNIISFINGVSKKKCDIFFANDFYGAIPALYMVLTKKCKYLVYDAHELFLKKEIPFFSPMRIFLFFEHLAIRRANLVVCAQKKRAEIMKEIYRLKEEPIVVKNYSELKIANNVLNAKYVDFFNSTKKTVVYVGYLSPDRKVDDLINAIGHRKEYFKLVLISADERFNELISTIEKKGIDCLGINGMPHDDLGDVLQLCDIGYLAYSNDTLNNRYCSPNKIYEYMSVGLAVLTNRNTGLAELIQQFDVGIATDDYESGLDTLRGKLNQYKENSRLVNVTGLMKSDLTCLRKRVSGLKKSCK